MRRIDDIPGTEYKIIQDKGLFSYGIDAILLSHFSKPKGIVVDLGTGTGLIPLRIVNNTKVSMVYGVEIQDQVAKMAKETMEMNFLQDKVKILNMDLKDLREIFSKATVDTIITNPPYMKPGGAIVSEKDNFAISRHEIAVTLEDIASISSYLLKPLGKLYMVHRPNRLVDVLCTLRNHGLEPKYIQWVYPKPGKPSNLFLLEAVKGGKSDFKFKEPILVYNKDGSYTEKIYKIYGISR